jgi:hypothetical protein
MVEEFRNIQQKTRALNFPADLPSIRCDANGVLSIRKDESDQPLTVRKMIVAHVERYDPHHQCDDVDAIVRATLGPD